MRHSLSLPTLGAAVLLALAAYPAQADEYGNYGKQTLMQLINDYPGRSAGSSKEPQAAEFMRGRMAHGGYQQSEQPFSFTASRGILSGQTLNSKNIVVSKQGQGSDQTLYVGAHYDTAFSTARLDRSTLQGLDDNSSGAAVLTELTRNLANIDTEHNLSFIAFGAEEMGLVGSKHFVAQMSAAERAKAIGMYNLDSLITGDFMYANGGDLSYDRASGQSVPRYAALRDHALAVAKELGITVKMNQGDKPVPGTNEPYKPKGVGCCSDQESFDAAGMPVVAFEATNWDLGPDFDGYTQTDNPGIPGGSTWHNPATDNWQFLTSVLGEERVDQRMRDFSRLLTRLIVEQTNADILASARQGGAALNQAHNAMRLSQSGMHDALSRRYLALQQGGEGVGDAQVWTDGGYTYAAPAYINDVNPAQRTHQGQIGIYLEQPLGAKTHLGGGLAYAVGYNKMQDSRSKINSQDLLATLYIHHGQGSGWWGNADAHYGRSRLNITRNIVMGGGDIPVILDRTEQGNTKGSIAGARVQTGWIWQHQNVDHGPYAGLDYSRIRIDGYGETGGSRTALSFKDHTSHSLEGQIGYQAAANQWEAGGVKWSPYARAAWVHEFKDGRFQRVDTVAQIDQGSRSVWLGDTDKSFARITLGLQAQITPRLGAYAELNTRLAHKEGKQPSGSLGVQYRF
ncbi:autotransporter domain-containing protein [Paralysiella testudinis]|uniref:Autotransporter domain-containing protein n=1 Tax=Paralysiella testudinis TaxID=2809020 RepID=A0A892ZL86_9NEIS|nr:autotransporter domain-containing protein [Paralysiella testudinis]QRQ83200.1 autotransporter domain-containing protein [Paralysiella testudinis]